MSISFPEAIPNLKNLASGIAFNPSPIQNIWVRPSGNDIDVVGSHISPSSTVMASTLYVLQIRSIIIVIKWNFNIRHFYRYYNKIIDRKRVDLLFKRL